uniref:nuclear transcription factor Y subunit B-5-like n=1 Tax=Erigeron canadensis TaxID=72917 RepID=UPI001CB8CDF6|nr:nuclear transcription factor Y subunit B-5-like [Erigeron canadensis]
MDDSSSSSKLIITTTGGEEDTANQQERLLPIANVGRIMKQILPHNAKISKEAKETMQECASEFISFVTGEASEKCKKERRKTVNGDDVCWAMGTLGFDDYAPPLKRYLDRYREVEGAAGATTPQTIINEDDTQLPSSSAPDPV